MRREKSCIRDARLGYGPGLARTSCAHSRGPSQSLAPGAKRHAMKPNDKMKDGRPSRYMNGDATWEYGQLMLWPSWSDIGGNRDDPNTYALRLPQSPRWSALVVPSVTIKLTSLFSVTFRACFLRHVASLGHAQLFRHPKDVAAVLCWSAWLAIVAWRRNVPPPFFFLFPLFTAQVSISIPHRLATIEDKGYHRPSLVGTTLSDIVCITQGALKKICKKRS